MAKATGMFTAEKVSEGVSKNGKPYFIRTLAFLEEGSFSPIPVYVDKNFAFEKGALVDIELELEPKGFEIKATLK